MVTWIIFLVVLVPFQAAGEEEEFKYDNKGRRSPFSAPVTGASTAKKATGDQDQEVIERIRGMLTGVLWGRKRPIAFLVGSDKEVVEIGDVIEGWLITDITRQGIVIKKGDRVVDLTIYEEEE